VLHRQCISNLATDAIRWPVNFRPSLAFADADKARHATTSRAIADACHPQHHQSRAYPLSRRQGSLAGLCCFTAMSRHPNVKGAVSWSPKQWLWAARTRRLCNRRLLLICRDPRPLQVIALLLRDTSVSVSRSPAALAGRPSHPLPSRGGPRGDCLLCYAQKEKLNNA